MWITRNLLLREGEDTVPSMIFFFDKDVLKIIMGIPPYCFFIAFGFQQPTTNNQQPTTNNLPTARFICARHIRQLGDGTWEYPPSTEVLREAGLFPIEEYIRRRRETAWRYTAGRPIFDACLESQCKERNHNRVLWWNINNVPAILELPGLSSSSD